MQEVFVQLSQKLPEFAYDRQKGPFRGWLWTVFVNKLRDRVRRGRGQPLQARSDELSRLLDSDHSVRISEQEHTQYLVRRALDVMRAEFEETTWRACWEVVVNELPPQTVAERLGISRNAVYIRKLKVLRRLRLELAEFFDPG